MATTAEIFVKRLKELMQEKQKSSYALADATGIPRTTISGWLTRVKNPNLDYLVTLANYFDCTVDYLIGRTNH